jgi:hypothetical protein
MQFSSAISKIDSRTKAIENSTSASQAHLRDFQGAVSRTASEMRDATAAQAAVKNSISRLVQICTGIEVGVEDFRSLVKSQHTDIRRHLNRMEQRQNNGLLIISSTSRDIISHVSRMESVLRQLVHLFGGFSIAALKLLQSILRTNLEIYALLRQIQSNLPRGPTRAIEDTFRFTDALGRTRELQYQWFKHWEVFESMLKCEFKRLPGVQRVLRGHYHILNAKRKSIIISPDQWEQSVFPGSDISMSIFITGLFFKQGLCPRQGCGTKNPLPSDGSALVVWSVSPPI